MPPNRAFARSKLLPRPRPSFGLHTPNTSGNIHRPLLLPNTASSSNIDGQSLLERRNIFL